MSLHVSIAEFESIAVSSYPYIVLRALADEFEPGMFSLIPSDGGRGVPGLEEGREMILAHIKETAGKREEMSFRYSCAIDSAEILLSHIKGGEKEVFGKTDSTASDIRKLEKMADGMPSETKEDMEDRKEVRKRISRLSAARHILYDGLLSDEKGSSNLSAMYMETKKKYEKERSGADRLLAEALGQTLGFRDRDIGGLEALVLKAKQTRDVIEMAQWKLLDCVDAAISRGWAFREGCAVPGLPFSRNLLSEKAALNAFFENGASFALALEGPIGTGKSAITKDISAAVNLEQATYAVPSIHSAFFGVPFHDKESGVVRIVPTEDGARLTTTPSCLVFDELLRVGSVGMDTQNMLLRLILDSEVSPGRKLHPLTLKIVTTNNPDDTSNPHSMRDWNEALANRMKHYYASVNGDMAVEWLAWARERFVTRDNSSISSARINDVLGYLSARLEERGPSVFHEVPKGKSVRENPSFPTFRTWAAVLGVARTTSLGPVDFARQAVSSLVGKKASDDFLKYVTANSAMPKLDDLLDGVREFPYVYLSAAADSIVVQKTWYDEPEGGLVSDNDGKKKKKKKKKQDDKEQKKGFAVKSLGRNTILQLNGGRHESSDRRSGFSGKTLIDRMTDSVNREFLDKSEGEICEYVEKFMNSLWNGVDGFALGAAAESMLIGALSAHMKNAFENREPADGKYISDILKIIALYPHPESRESMFRSIDRLLVSNPDKATVSGLRKYGVDYSPAAGPDDTEPVQRFIKKLPEEADPENPYGKKVLIGKLLAVFPTLATLEMASERWSRGCGRAATKYTAAERDKAAVPQGVPVRLMEQENDGPDGDMDSGAYFPENSL